MRIHTDHLTSTDLHDALRASGLADEGIYLDAMAHRSRKRHHAFEVRLPALAGRDRNGKLRRPPVGGPLGPAISKAATYDEWGWWLAELFDRDPDMTATYYKSREDFHAQTGGKYAVEVAAA